MIAIRCKSNGFLSPSLTNQIIETISATFPTVPSSGFAIAKNVSPVLRGTKSLAKSILNDHSSHEKYCCFMLLRRYRTVRNAFPLKGTCLIFLKSAKNGISRLNVALDSFICQVKHKCEFYKLMQSKMEVWSKLNMECMHDCTFIRVTKSNAR